MGRLRIATWNCFGAPQDFGDLVTGTPLWPERLDSAELAAELGAFDVVCVQEDFVGRTTDALERLRDACGFRVLWSDRSGVDLEARVYGSGLAVLSRFPLTASLHTFTPAGLGYDRFARKGFVSAAVLLPDHVVVRVVATHLQSDAENVPEEAVRAVRDLQLAQLRAHVAALPPDPLVVCGDFNVAAGTPEHADLAADFAGLGLYDLVDGPEPYTSDPVVNDMLRCNEPNAPRERIDYVFVATPPRWRVRLVDGPRRVLDRPLSDVGSRPGKCAEGTRPFASDHFGVGAALELARAEPRVAGPMIAVGADGTIAPR